MAANTTTYSFLKPTVGGDTNVWGGFLNTNLDDLDDLLDGTSPVSGIDINGGSIDGTPIGAAAASTGAFTNLSATTPLPVASGGTAGATAAAARTALSAQQSDPLLTAIAALTTSANKLIYATGLDAVAQTDLTAFARTLLDDADQAAAKVTLGIVSELIDLADYEAGSTAIYYGNNSVAGSGIESTPRGTCQYFRVGPFVWLNGGMVTYDWTAAGISGSDTLYIKGLPAYTAWPWTGNAAGEGPFFGFRLPVNGVLFWEKTVPVALAYSNAGNCVLYATTTAGSTPAMTFANTDIGTTGFNFTFQGAMMIDPDTL